jgi:hypothetical protein
LPCSFDDKVIIEKAEFKKFTAGGDIFRVGIICDTQLPPNEKKLEENDLYVRHLRTALEELKNNGVGMILFAGDIGDEGSYFAFKTYQSVIDEVFGEDKPVIQTIMGNHDYWSESALSANTTKTNPSGRYAADFGRSQNKILEFNEKQALSDIWQCLLLLYLFDFFRLDTAKKINLDNDRKFLYNKIRSGIQKILL